jgi:hypothetical protein
VCLCGVEPRQVAAPCGRLWQSVVRCIADRLQAPRQAPVRSLGIVVMLSVQRRYCLLNCLPTILLLLVVADKFTPSDVQTTNYSLVYQSWLSLFWSVEANYSLLDVSELAIPSWRERWLMLSLERRSLLYRSLLFSLLCHWLVGRFGRHGL